MDFNGIPQKINRHVLNAIAYHTERGIGPTFSRIYEYVKKSNASTKPVEQLGKTIKQALKNFQSTGIVQRGVDQRYRIRCSLIFADLKRKTEEVEPQSKIRNKSRKRNKSDTSFGEANTLTDRKRRRISTLKHIGDSKRTNMRVPSQINFAQGGPYRANPEASNIDEYYNCEPGADDRDSGDNLRERSSDSLDIRKPLTPSAWHERVSH